MNIAINKDIEKYQETVVLGLTAKQLIFSVIAVVCGGSIVLLTYKYIGLTGSAYVAIPVVAPIALNGFYTFQGMSFTEMLKRKLKLMFSNPVLVYSSEEGVKAIDEYRLEEINKKKQQDKKDKKGKKTRKEKIIDDNIK